MLWSSRTLDSTEDDVSVVEDSVITRVEQYSQPRLVEYSCEDFILLPTLVLVVVVAW